MRILIVAYEFPPSPSPGAIRWRYLARELASLGHAVEVLAPELWSGQQSPSVPEGVLVHRTFAGPLCGLTAWRGTARSNRTGSIEDIDTGDLAKRLKKNWKGIVIDWLKNAAGVVLFPDIRAEWRPWATRALERLLQERRPDLVISAHEPATTLQIGFMAQRRDIPWIIDLGDPVLAPYTPRRWRRHALALERNACLAATHIVVTTTAAQELLMERHGVAQEKTSVITQGFEDRQLQGSQVTPGLRFDPELLEVFYAGRFYPFRRPHELIRAVIAVEGVRLTIASPNVPVECMKLSEGNPEKLRLVGAVTHSQAQAMQRCADVLVNIGNDGLAAQVPGKLYEYLGASKPVLHLLAAGDSGQDSSSCLLDQLDAGWRCANEYERISAVLSEMRSIKHKAKLATSHIASAEAIAPYGWSRLGKRYSQLLESINQASGRLPKNVTDK